MLIDKHAENGIRDCLKVSIHSTIKKVSEDYERMSSHCYCGYDVFG